MVMTIPLSQDDLASTRELKQLGLLSPGPQGLLLMGSLFSFLSSVISIRLEVFKIIYLLNDWDVDWILG
jgi:hypothetical protein